MTTWFMRLGTSKNIVDKNLYQALAKKYSIVKIGYGIEHDITKKDREGIKDYLANRGESGRSLGIRATLIHSFTKNVKEGDIIICPFGRGSDKLRVGEVVSECAPLKTFFDNERELDKFLAKYTGEKESQKIKPARKVRWITEEKSKSKFSHELQVELSKFMPATITRLKNEEEYSEDKEDEDGIEIIKKSENFDSVKDYSFTDLLISEFSKTSDFMDWVIRNISVAATSAIFSALVALLFGQDSFNWGIAAGFLVFVLGAIAGFYASRNKE